MSDTPQRSPEEAPQGRRWFVILAIVTLVGFALFVGVITVCAVRIPELRKPKYGLPPAGIGVRSA